METIFAWTMWYIVIASYLIVGGIFILAAIVKEKLAR
jgi:hypothetical protein